MYEQKLFTLKKLRDCFDAIESELIRFPALNLALLRSRVEQFIEQCKSTLEMNK